MGGTYTGSSSQNTRLIELLKKNGYQKGGTIGDLVRKTGEDGFILARSGEEVLSIPKLKIASSMVDDLIGYSKSNNKKSSTSVGDVFINMEFPNVQNYEQFKSQLISDRNFDKYIKTTIGESLSNNGMKLKKNKFK